jgi:Uma2 family endonuclease
MSTTKVKKRPLQLGPEDNGILMTPEEFDRADFDELWVFELINGVLVVSPIPSEQEADPNEELGHLLRTYRESHPQGSSLDKTLPERYVRVGSNRRRADRVIWAGLGRRPRKNETPTIIVEFVSVRRRDRVRDFETKRDEYFSIEVKEIWIIDRFERNMVVFSRQGGKLRKRLIREEQLYKTALLPGFELPLARLLALADNWSSEEEQEQQAE